MNRHDWTEVDWTGMNDAEIGRGLGWPPRTDAAGDWGIRGVPGGIEAPAACVVFSALSATVTEARLMSLRADELADLEWLYTCLTHLLQLQKSTR